MVEVTSKIRITANRSPREWVVSCGMKEVCREQHFTD
jgi:hypothetical protein